MKQKPTTPAIESMQFLMMAIRTMPWTLESGEPTRVFSLDITGTRTGAPDKTLRLITTPPQFLDLADQVAQVAAMIRSGQPLSTPKPPGPAH